MPNSKSSKKSIIRSEKKRSSNSSRRSTVRTWIKKMNSIIKLQDKNKATQTFSLIQSILDKMARKKIIHKNKAARHKSKLFSKIKNMK